MYDLHTTDKREYRPLLQKYKKNNKSQLSHKATN